MGYGRGQQMRNDRCGNWSRSSDVETIGAGVARKLYRSGVAGDISAPRNMVADMIGSTEELSRIDQHSLL